MNNQANIQRGEGGANPVPIPAKALAQLDAIRLEGKSNMLDRTTVQRLAYEANAFELVVWIEDHAKDYAEGLFRGFVAEEGTTPETAK